MLRFKVGDLVRVMVSRGAASLMKINQVGEIHKVGPWPIGTPCTKGGFTDALADYDVIFADGLNVLFLDWQLAPIDPPAEPASLTRHAEDECTA